MSIFFQYWQLIQDWVTNIYLHPTIIHLLNGCTVIVLGATQSQLQKLVLMVHLLMEFLHVEKLNQMSFLSSSIFSLCKQIICKSLEACLISWIFPNICLYCTSLLFASSGIEFTKTSQKNKCSWFSLALLHKLQRVLPC